jgi:hypothetical protein
LHPRTRKIAAAGIVTAGILFIFALYSFTLSDKDAASRDFISYWAAGQFLAHGQSPYGVEAVRNLERAAGRNSAVPVLLMRNPPLALFLVASLGHMSPKTGLIVWLLALESMVALSIWLLWRLNGEPRSPFHLLGFVFPPVLVCYMAGQFGVFLLLGVVLFLYFHRTRPMAAGAALLFCALKPHLFLPFGLVVLIWVFCRRRLAILAGFLLAVVASCALAWGIDPHAWPQYFYMIRHGGALNEAVPTVSAALRLALPSHPAWSQYVLELLAAVWAIWYFWRHRLAWDWMDHGLLLLLVGCVCTPYGWFTDESLLLPAVLVGACAAEKAHRPVWPLAVAAGAMLLEVALGAEITSWAFVWTPLAWLAWFLFSTGRLSLRRRLLAIPA